MFQPVYKGLSTGDTRSRRTATEILGPPTRTIADSVPHGDQGSRKKRLTPARKRKRERCVKAQKRGGSSTSKAFAICTASVTGTTKRRRRRS